MIDFFRLIHYNFIMMNKYKFGNISKLYHPVYDDPALPAPLDPVKAGFTSPAESYIGEELKISDFIEHPVNTFFLKVSGDSMINFGIMDKSFVSVEANSTAKSLEIILVEMDHEFNIKQYFIDETGRRFLVPGNDNYDEVEIREGMSFNIRGVVTNSITTFKVRELIRGRRL